MTLSDTLEQIILNLSSPAESVKKQAETQLLYLAQQNPPEALQRLLNILWQDPDSDQGTAPLYANVRVALRLLGDPARDALLAEMRNHNHLRLVTNALHHWRTDPLVRAGWIELASAPVINDQARMNAIYGLGIYPHRDSIDVLLALANDPRPVIALTASRQFFGYKDADLQAELYSRWQARESYSPNQRAALACGLIGNHPRGDGEILEQTLADPDPQVRLALAHRLRSLTHFMKWARPVLLRLMTEDGSPDVREAALEYSSYRAQLGELDLFLKALRLEMRTNSLAKMYFVLAFQKMGSAAIAAVTKCVPPNALWNEVARDLGRR